MKIKLVHILNNINGDREIKSIKNLSRLKNVGVEYVQQITPLYEGDAHSEIKALTWTPTSPHNKRHYGNYLSYKQAIKENFSSDLDALIVCECDTYLELTNDEFLEEIKKTLYFCEKYDTYQFSWGGYCKNTLHTDEEYPDYIISDKIVLAHFNIFPKSSREFYLTKIDNFGWDAADIWLNEIIFSEQNLIKKQALTNKNFCKQIEGLSYLDNIKKGVDIKDVKYSNDVAAILTYCNTQVKLNVLNEQIDFIRKNTTFKIAIHANYPLPVDTQKKVDHYFYEDLNKVINEITVNVWLVVAEFGKKFTFSFPDTGYSSINQIKNIIKYLEEYDKILFTNYDTIIEKQHIVNHTLLKNDILIYNNSTDGYMTLLLFSGNQKKLKNLDLSLENYLSIKNKTAEEKLKFIIKNNNITIEEKSNEILDKITNMPYITYNDFFKRAIMYKSNNILNIFIWESTLKINLIKIKIGDSIFVIENKNKNNAFNSTLETTENIENIKIIEINNNKTDITLQNISNIVVEDV